MEPDGNHFNEGQYHQTNEVHPVWVFSKYSIMRQFITSVQIEEREDDDPYQVNEVPVKSEILY